MSEVEGKVVLDQGGVRFRPRSYVCLYRVEANDHDAAE